MATQVQITFDCANPAQLSAFWAQALHYKIQDPPAGYPSWDAFLSAQHVPEELCAVVDPEGKGPRIFFQRVPEPKSVKNRVHLDLNASRNIGTDLSDEDLQRVLDAEIERLKALGAHVVTPFSQNGEHWIVMTDPEGNEFCVQ